MGLNSDTLLRLAGRARTWAAAQSPQARALARRLRKPSTIPLLLATVVLPILAIFNAFVATAAPGTMYASGVTFPFNGVFLDSQDGGHYWDGSGSGLCRIDADPASTTGFSENVGTCDIQSKKPTQVVAGPVNADGTYFLYAADMAAKSTGPVRLVYDPNADPDPNTGLGRGAVVANSAVLVGGLNTVGFFSDASASFLSSSVALGPCNKSVVNPVVDPSGTCLALYVGFRRSKKIERINFVDQPLAQQTIEEVSATADPRKGVRFGIATFKNADGTTDLYIDELGGLGVTILHDVATCPPNTNGVGGCAASVVGGIPTFFPQGIATFNDPATGLGKYIYVADVPADDSPPNTSTVMRYHPDTGFLDIITSTVPTYDSLLNPGQPISVYTFIMGLAVNPHTGDLFIGDDPTFPILVNPPLNKGHLWTVPATAAPDCVGSALNTCTIPPPPALVTASLFAYGVTAPKGGAVLVPGADGQNHLWAADHSAGFCRFDPVPGTGLHAINPAACDDGTVLGSGGQAAYDPTLNPDGVTHYIYVAQNDHLSPGVLRFTYDPTLDGGKGMVINPPVILAPNAGLDGDKANGVVLGPCVKNADGTLKFPGCKFALYTGGLVDGFIRRVNNPEDDPRNQVVDVVAQTQAQQVGGLSRGINGSIGMIGDNLYLPENNAFTVVNNISSKCPVVNADGTKAPCDTQSLNIGTAGLIFAAGIATDPDPSRSPAGLVYASISSGFANATVYQYDVATNTARLYLANGQMPPAGSADATVYCTTTCTRPIDPSEPPGALVSMNFLQGELVDPDTGSLIALEDKFAGARGGRGHIWVAPFVPYPAGVTPVPTPTPPPPPATLHTCSITINVPSLPSGQTYWVQFTAHAVGTISAKWTIPVAQSAQLLLYTGNPFTGLADPVAKGPTGKPIASQNTSNTASFNISATNQPAGTYTVQFFNASNSFGGTVGTITYVNDAATLCPASPAASNILN